MPRHPDDAPQSQLASAVEGAQRLLHYASARGIPLDEALVAEIVDSRSLASADENDPATFARQKAFWKALTMLASRTAPASVASLRYNETAHVTFLGRMWAKLTGGTPKPTPVGEAAVRRAGFIALVLLLVMGVLQAYVETGSTTLQTYYENQAKYERNDRLIEQAAQQSAAQTETAIQWRVEKELLERQTQRQLMIMKAWLPWLQFAGAPNSPEHAQEVLATTEWILTVLRGFLLPAGWGLIGAALYVLRTLSADLGTRAYSQDHATLHSSRYYLGAVSGFVVAKFSMALSGKVVDNAVQPFVMALLVGYSVDVLFNLFNKLISVFSPKA